MTTTMKRYTEFLHNIRGKILLGCDGFVDETYVIVEVRKSQSDFTPMKNLKQFGELLVERADGGVTGLRAELRELDGDDVDAIVQVGTNMSMVRLAAAAEMWLGKPVIAINTATYWHALRANGINDKIPGMGRLLEEF